MKRILVGIIIIGLVITGLFVFKESKTENNLTKVKVGEVTHSVFYAPQYVAKSLGYFEEEGLDVEIILTAGADKVTASVLSGDVQIGFCGSEATIYVYNGGEKDYLINFAGLTKRDGSFLVSRKKISDFSLEDLKGKKILAGREGGMPAMTLEYALNSNGISSDSLNLDTSVEFSAMSGSFIGGNGDFVSLFEPTASELENKGYGYIVASIGKLGGVVPYTAYNAKKSYIKENPDVIKGFSTAIQKGLDYVHTHSAIEVADVIANEFPDTSKKDLAAIVQNYMNIDSWFDNIYIEESDFNHIEEIMNNAGKLDKKAPYKKLVTTKYTTK
ncbi:MAG: ABC transporter substrate-binding protein [Bacilli bacterium]|nr:ABC transporter substrate-binding protein [Bacilli bacterium]